MSGGRRGVEPAQKPPDRQLCKHLNPLGHRVGVSAARKQVLMGKRILNATDMGGVAYLGSLRIGTL